MKRISCLLCILTVFACSREDGARITLDNSLPFDRKQEIVAIDLGQLATFTDEYGDAFVLTDEAGAELPWQLTHDNQLIFPATVKAGGSSAYYIKPGNPTQPTVVASGKQYPERLDDVAWENDRMAFRTYGPALQATGERAFGYDLWAKRVATPIVEARYAKELNPDSQGRIAELRKTDPQAANELYQSISYHNDHGDGLDFYSVGPTLGAGTSALLAADGSIIYPYCYCTYEILDNGPLRFTVKLTYNPQTVDSDTAVVETRLISLDAGSQLNRITLGYENLSKPTPIVTGIVLHAPSDDYQADASKGYIAYADPATETNGQLYIGASFPDPSKLTDAKPVYFSDAEKKERGNANGQLLAYSTYQPGTTYTYYAGGGWSKWGFETPEAWYQYMTAFTEKLQKPLQVKELSVTIHH